MEAAASPWRKRAREPENRASLPRFEIVRRHTGRVPRPRAACDVGGWRRFSGDPLSDECSHRTTSVHSYRGTVTTQAAPLGAIGGGLQS